jgi:lipoprotein-anchoring transpeptidase ErfK/SrfK
MSWYYGPNNPMNYDLPNVPWVASFKGPYTIHGAYWHHNFGHPMSHGCVNMKVSEAKIIYDWAEIGTPVIIYQ